MPANNQYITTQIMREHSYANYKDRSSSHMMQPRNRTLANIGHQGVVSEPRKTNILTVNRYGHFTLDYKFFMINFSDLGANASASSSFLNVFEEEEMENQRFFKQNAQVRSRTSPRRNSRDLPVPVGANSNNMTLPGSHL